MGNIFDDLGIPAFDNEIADVDYSKHSECDKCKRVVKPADPLSELFCEHERKRGADGRILTKQTFLCISCTQKLDVPLPADVLLRIGLQTTKAREKQMKARLC